MGPREPRWSESLAPKRAAVGLQCCTAWPHCSGDCQEKLQQRRHGILILSGEDYKNLREHFVSVKVPSCCGQDHEMEVLASASGCLSRPQK